MSVVFPLFSTPLYYEKLDVDLFRTITNVKKLDYEESSGAWISKNQFIFDNTSFFEVKDYVETELKKYIHSELEVSEQLKLTHTSSWVCKHLKGNKSQQHLHSNSMFSGILYLQCDEKSGGVEFATSPSTPTYCTSTINLQSFIKDSNVLNSRIWYKKPEPGDLFLFPSHLLHKVEASESDEERYCIAFNYVLTGEYNVSSGYLNFKHERLY